MTPEGLSALVTGGSAGAVIAVVLIFLNFIAKRDSDWRDFFNNIRKADGEASTKLAGAIDRLVTRIETLENKFDAHDSTEMEFLRSVVGNMDRKTQPRRKAGE